MALSLPRSNRSLYVHVPFCARKCNYCAFYSEPAQGALVERYVRALLLEMERLGPQPFHTIFFGGGTPSLLNLSQWERILAQMDRLGWVAPGVEFTVECNPATLSLEKAKLLRSGGVRRVSMGVQSLDAGLLDRLGRVHSRDMVFRSYDQLRQAGMEQVNLDLMFAIPGQSLEVWQSTLREAARLEPEHLSCYEVIYEEDTPLFQMLQAGEVQTDEDLACRMYDLLLEETASAGYAQYEVANFARGARSAEGIPAHACRHNIHYWRGGEYFALGPAACGYLDGVRTRNWSNTPMYCECVETGRPVVESRDVLPPHARAGEIAAFGLRMNAGWSFETFESVTGFDLRVLAAEPMDRAVRAGWAEQLPDRFRLTAAGMRFADRAAMEFLVTECVEA